MSWFVEYPESNPFRVKGPNTLGGFIKMRRKTLGLSQRVLAKQMGLAGNNTTVSNFETGKVTPSELTLMRLARALAVSIQDLRSFHDLDQAILDRRNVAHLRNG